MQVTGNNSSLTKNELIARIETLMEKPEHAAAFKSKFFEVYNPIRGANILGKRIGGYWSNRSDFSYATAKSYSMNHPDSATKFALEQVIGELEKKLNSADEGIWSSVRENNVQQIKSDINNGANLNQINNHGFSLLSSAIDRQNAGVLKLLLEAGAKSKSTKIRNTSFISYITKLEG